MELKGMRLKLGWTALMLRLLEMNCPKKPKQVFIVHSQTDSEGFQEVKRKDKASYKHGFHVGKQKQKVEYRPVNRVESVPKSMKGSQDKMKGSLAKPNIGEGVVMSNSFSCLQTTEAGETSKVSKGEVEDDSDIEEVYNETELFMKDKDLWKELKKHRLFVKDRPWVVLGDFNETLSVDDNAVGSSKISTGMREFQECVKSMEMMDIVSSGLRFTWSQKPKRGVGILKKIDRVMGNMEFIDQFRSSHVVFLPSGVSDHTPCLLKIPCNNVRKPKPFKFANFLVNKKGFKEVVAKAWQAQVSGNWMYCLVKKLKVAKPGLRKLLFQQGNLHENVTRLRTKVEDIQKLIDSNPFDVSLRESEARLLKEFEVASYDEELFLKQKAKVEWLSAGDSNSAYFHKSLKCKLHRGKFGRVSDVHGNVFEGDLVPMVFVDHYKNFLGSETSVDMLNVQGLFTKRLDVNMAGAMVREVTSDEIKDAMFSIGNDRAPGPDGFTAAFFKKSWDTVGSLVILAIKDFFTHSRLLKEVNHTIIALIPKVASPGKSCRTIMGVLEEFKDCSGLVPSIAKSTVYFCNVGTDVKREILEIMSFEEGCLEKDW
ncbi:hypothetical protein QVD17_07072 [Tagetes erecta]|uniref:RNA-directed DNA polymerase, eukaryota, reverse transcriptase zinc-binding domain protein n=1 Tax=Tagetes erecta TaxID=13708 RepID=A0AAD8PCC7_TARER|nr:hypothetical protein QVD17_07072 [Tagetes erecta]